ncbi:MAG TPA: NAD(P)/FAD-dependent oxidoreductase [Puia sp.]|nr:NAD(P)/FAD-dependent oxidoreductase [Puia sp.]
MSKTLIVVGGGAAGFFCAVNAARLHPGLRCILLEKSNKFLSKVKVSGGGRCNVTHACYIIDDMIKNYPRGSHFLKKSFHQFFTTDTIQWLAERGVQLKTEPDGRMFPISNQSQTIIDCLFSEANRYHVETRLQADVKKIEISQPSEDAGGNKFRVHLAGSTPLESDFVCLATGGYPKSSMFDWIRELGHTIEPPVPSLFTFNMPGHPVTKLMGVSVPDVLVNIRDTGLSERGPLLITHWGMSGPVVLRLSAWGAREMASRQYRFTAVVNWLPEFREHTLAEKLKQLQAAQGSQKMDGRNPFDLPQRLWIHQLSQAGINENTRWADLLAAARNRLVKELCTQAYEVTGKTTFKEEFVTAGGIRLSEIDPHTMQSRKIPGLYLAGEIMDVDGITGGFNFQHAWTSGFLAAKAIAASTS